MNCKLNNKGFTLIELLAVLVILSAIMGIAIPSISSSMERNKVKQNEARKKVLLSAAELYVSNHKNAIVNNMSANNECYISLDDLVDDNLVSDSAIKDSDDKRFSGGIIYNKSTNEVEYKESVSGIGPCGN